MAGQKPKSIAEMPMSEVVDRIEKLNRGLGQFWAKSQGWAPVEAAGLLGKARLDWQEFLSATLRTWLKEGAVARSAPEGSEAARAEREEASWVEAATEPLK